MGAIAEMASATNHGQIHADASALDRHRNHVRINLSAGVDRLLLQNPPERRHPVSIDCGFLKSQILCSFQHGGFKFGHQSTVFATQKPTGLNDIGPISLGLNRPNARRAAAVDLCQQARTAAVNENRVLAAAQPKHLLQHLDTLFDRPGVGIRAKVLPVAINPTAVIR